MRLTDTERRVLSALGEQGAMDAEQVARRLWPSHEADHSALSKAMDHMLASMSHRRLVDCAGASTDTRPAFRATFLGQRELVSSSRSAIAVS